MHGPRNIRALGVASALAVCIVAVAAWQTPARAADNVLTQQEAEAGWQLLFNGRDLRHWKTNDGAPPADGLVQQGAVNVHGSGGQLLVYDRQFADFILSCEVRMSQPHCNSGIFIRVSDLENPVMTGLEIQVNSQRGSTVHDFGAIYDLVAPKKNASKGSDAWEHVEIHCQGPQITVAVNGEHVTEMNCDEFDRPGLRPDGSPHKFGRAIKDFARKGYLGFQDHGQDVWYKNVKLLEL